MRQLFSFAAASDPQPVAEAGHELEREWPGLPSLGNREIGVFAHELPAQSPCFAACPRHRRSGDRHSLRPERARAGRDTAFHPAQRAIVTAGGEMGATHADEAEMAQRLERHEM